MPTKDFSGLYIAGDGASWFSPSNATPSDQKMWVTFTGSSVAQLEDARKTGRLVAQQPSYVRFRAVESTDRSVGPGGPALLVTEILEMRRAKSETK